MEILQRTWVISSGMEQHIIKQVTKMRMLEKKIAVTVFGGIAIAVLVWIYSGQLLYNFAIDNPGLVILALAGVCVSVMDTLSDHHFPLSIFRKLNSFYWDAEVSWINKCVELPRKRAFEGGILKKIGIAIIIVLAWAWYLIKVFFLDMFGDGWHLFKTFHDVILVIGIALLSNQGPDPRLWMNAVIFYCAYKVPFTICYSFLFKVEKKN